MSRISVLLWLIAFAALNLALLRYAEAVIDLGPKFVGLVGLWPLFDVFAVSLCVALTRRFRFALARREVRKSVVDSVAMMSGAILVMGTTMCLLFPEVALQPVELLYPWFDRRVGLSKSTPETRGFLIAALLGMVLSGPPIFLALVLGSFHSRFKLEITRRGPAQGSSS
jgi:hypothetical protein